MCLLPCHLYIEDAVLPKFVCFDLLHRHLTCTTAGFLFKEYLTCTISFSYANLLLGNYF